MSPSKIMEWIFGYPWDAEGERKRRDKKIADAEAEYGRMTSRVYEDTLRQMAESNLGTMSQTEGRTMSVEIADSLMINLSAIQMIRDDTIRNINEAYSATEKEMSVKSRWFLPRLWIEWRQKK